MDDDHDVKQGARSWTSVKPGRASNQIVEQVTRELLAGRLRPGDYLGSETDLAAQFGVSRTTVRSAVRELETLGAVTVQVGAGGGVRIAQGDVMKFVDVLAIQLQLVGVDREEMIDTQLAIESHAAEGAARTITDEQLAELAEIVRATERVTDVDEFAQLAVRFHAAIVAAHGNHTLTAMHRSLGAAMTSRFRAGARASSAVRKRVVREHREVFDAIAAGDGALARRLMHAHICTARSELRGTRRTRRSAASDSATA
jgi:DNA-binding FadR family transcriptional regulator